MPDKPASTRMQLHHIAFVLTLLAFCWQVMMSLHELGHVLGAVLTGGTVTGVVLHPFAISRTDVIPNPYPGVVVWFGPLFGSLAPLVLMCIVPRQMAGVRQLMLFLVGFCLVANGSYIAGGSWQQVGDCREMLRTGTPQWVMILFGAVTIPAGLQCWHRMGTAQEVGFWIVQVRPGQTMKLVVCTLVVGVIGWALSI